MKNILNACDDYKIKKLIVTGSYLNIMGEDNLQQTKWQREQDDKVSEYTEADFAGVRCGYIDTAVVDESMYGYNLSKCY